MLINLRNALMAGKRLPYDAEVEYLESDGDAYAVAPNNIFSKQTGFRVELTLSTGSATFSAVSALLAAGGDIQGPPYYYRVATNKTAQFASPGVNWFSLFTDGDVHTVSTTNVNLTNTGIYSNTDVDGTRVLSGSYSNANKTFDDTVGIFAFNNGNNKCPAGIRIYSIVAFDENGNKTADYIPVRKGTVGYLYDRVTGKLFGNAGTGDFVVGQDVVPVEYIESHGTEYINTGVKGHDGYDFEYRFRPMSPLPCGIGGEYESNQSCYIGLVRSNGNLAYNYSNPNVIVEVQSLTLGMDYNVKAHLYSGEQYFEVNGVRGGEGSRTGTFTSSYNLYLFAINSNNQPANFGVMRLYNLTAHLNTIPIRSFRPIRIGTDATSWEGAVMDVLTRRIYRNAGTGAFGYGNDLKYPIPAS